MQPPDDQHQRQQRPPTSNTRSQPPLPTPEACRRRASLFLAASLGSESFDQLTLQGLSLVSAGPGEVVCRLTAHARLQNKYGTLHGGAIATLVDVVGTLAVITRSDRGGVSLSISTHYLSPLPGGEEVEVRARLVKLGRDVATVEVTLFRTSTDELVAQGTHVKKLVSASDMAALFAPGLSTQAAQQQQPQPSSSPAAQRSRL